MNGGGALAEKVVAAAGGGSGIGRAVVESFVAEGASVAILEIDETKCEKLASDLPSPRVEVVHGDARRAPDNELVVSTARSKWGKLDVGVSFVGVFDFYRPLVDIPDNQFDAAFAEIFETNVKSPLLLARAALPALRSTGGALIFTLSSSSFYAGRGGPLYVSSKFALRGAVLQLAREEAPRVRVNGVAPGGTLGTDLRGAHSLELSGERLEDRPGRREELEARTPLHVALTGEDHTGAYVYLASDRARGVTGEVIRSDGGLSVR